MIETGGIAYKEEEEEVNSINITNIRQMREFYKVKISRDIIPVERSSLGRPNRRWSDVIFD